MNMKEIIKNKAKELTPVIALMGWVFLVLYLLERFANGLSDNVFGVTLLLLIAPGALFSYYKKIREYKYVHRVYLIITLSISFIVFLYYIYIPFRIFIIDVNRF